jgi:hypothetical protein
MKTKQPPSYLELLEEINDLYGEHIEMGVPVDTFLLSRLHREREKVHYLEQKVEYFEKRYMHDSKNL